jgi:hypothetical protein
MQINFMFINSLSCFLLRATRAGCTPIWLLREANTSRDMMDMLKPFNGQGNEQQSQESWKLCKAVACLQA